jgi:hypothetical protein
MSYKFTVTAKNQGIEAVLYSIYASELKLHSDSKEEKNGIINS